MNNKKEMIKLKGIKKIYSIGEKKVHALRGVNLEIERNEFISIIGPSGSGKSTLLNILGCLDAPTEGEYYLEGINVQELNHNQLAEIRNKKIGFVFQNFNLLPYATIFENVEIPMIFKGIPAKERKRRVEELLDKVRLGDRMNHRPSELSGGEMQRVAIARALANNPSIILADEPTGNLDTRTGEEIVAIFENLWKEGNTILIVTHNPEISKRARRVIKLIDGMIK